MKKLITLLLVGLILMAGGVQTASAAEATFIIGNGTYVVNEEVRQDTAPYIKNGRTYLPLRYAAYAVGIGDNSIYWGPVLEGLGN